MQSGPVVGLRTAAIVFGVLTLVSTADAQTAPEAGVHLRLRSLEKETARISAQQADGTFAFLCETPCDTTLLPGVVLRFVLQRDACEPSGTDKCERKDAWNGRTYVVPEWRGGDVDVEVRAASTARNVGYVAGGIVSLLLGVSGVVGGVILKGNHGQGYAPTLGTVVSVFGCTALVAGIILMAVGPTSRPRVDDTIPRRSAERPRIELRADANGIGLSF